MNNKGSITAKQGFDNETQVVSKFNNWEFDEDAKAWLIIMGYLLEEIESVKAQTLREKVYKTDVQVEVLIKLKNVIDLQNLQVKLVSNKSGYNQVDKRWVSKYRDLWDIPRDIEILLKRYTGEIKPIANETRDPRRTFADEFTYKEQAQLIDWLRNNKTLIISDILKGRGRFSAEWILIIQKTNTINRWLLEPINIYMNFFGNGDIYITPKGNIKIGNITMQRKGGDAGRNTANMLQFKINPILFFDKL